MDDFFFNLYISEALFEYKFAAIEFTYVVFIARALLTEKIYDYQKIYFVTGYLKDKKETFANNNKKSIISFDFIFFILIAIVAIIFSLYASFLYKHDYLNNISIEFAKSVILFSVYIGVLLFAIGIMELIICSFIKLKLCFRP